MNQESEMVQVWKKRSSEGESEDDVVNVLRVKLETTVANATNASTEKLVIKFVEEGNAIY